MLWLSGSAHLTMYSSSFRPPSTDMRPFIAKPLVVKPLVVKPFIVKPLIDRPFIVKPFIVKPFIEKPFSDVSALSSAWLSSESCSHAEPARAVANDRDRVEIRRIPFVCAVSVPTKTLPHVDASALFSSLYLGHSAGIVAAPATRVAFRQQEPLAGVELEPVDALDGGEGGN